MAVPDPVDAANPAPDVAEAAAAAATAAATATTTAAATATTITAAPYSAEEFLQNAYLTYIVPFATRFDPREAFRPASGSVESSISAVEQRDQLFFDETVDVYLILRAPYAHEPVLRAHLRRLVLTLDTHIINSPAADRETPPASEIVHDAIVENPEDAVVVADDAAANDGPRYAYAVWKVPVFLARPRMRLHLPTAVFSGAASLRVGSESTEPANARQAGYMQSCVPSTMNLLESFAADPLLGGVVPRLSAQRVAKVAPLTKPKDELRRISGRESLRLSIYPVLHTRVRFSRPNTVPPSASMIAVLEIDFTPYFDCEAALDKLALSVADGTVEDLNAQDGMRLPLSCVAHDHLTFLYRLAPQKRDVAPKNLTRELVIAIEVLILVRPEGEPNPCTPRLVMTWPTSIDFTPPVNPGFGQLKSAPIQRSHRPSQLSIGGGVLSQPLVSPSVMRPDALPALEAATAPPPAPPLPDFGITVTFTGPPGPVSVGDEFAWSVFVVNRSKADAIPPPPSAPASVLAQHAAATAARKLMLIPIPRRRLLARSDMRTARFSMASHPSPHPAANPGAAAASSSFSSGRNDALVAAAVLDEPEVHAAQRAAAPDCPDLVCLSADVRVGPLAPGACAVVELRFVALREGVVGLEAVRVLDLGSQEHVDVRELPLVVVKA
ncbi:hypothetical protein VTJ83DRAFT_2152 [Remersonia thermophila]|uniref:Trafficking protein particle complex II-specific subunit 65 IgD3 domain-containing protein n=1 Tax=Remersonia thermophila TaxID=72144 RepID=A0ABR4DHX2_9PEZI